MERYFKTRKEFKKCMYADAFRYVGDHGHVKRGEILRYYLRHPQYRYVYWMRVAQYTYGRKALLLLRGYAMMRLQQIRNKTCIQISPSTRIGKGLYIGHFGSIVINPAVVLGENINIIQTCTIGVGYRGERRGLPTIGDNVYIGAGARIFGGINIGNNVAIGVNSVVTRDVPDNAVVAGAPAKVISMTGSEGYIYTYIDKEGVKHPRFEK